MVLFRSFRSFLISGMVLLVLLMAISAYHASHPEQPSLAFPQTREQKRQAEILSSCLARVGLSHTADLRPQHSADYGRCLFQLGY
jgi:hypothetical protein